LGANLLKGVPFADNSVDVVYHSHVLEHFWDTDGLSFMKECFRVLKPNGIIRVVVPDLEQIVRVYLTNLEAGLKAEPLANEKHKWSLLE
jgi:predicted SAM-dependent methyltransferase